MKVDIPALCVACVATSHVIPEKFCSNSLYYLEKSCRSKSTEENKGKKRKEKRKEKRTLLKIGWVQLELVQINDTVKLTQLWRTSRLVFLG
jgi:hypothetical protein